MSLKAKCCHQEKQCVELSALLQHWQFCDLFPPVGKGPEDEGFSNSQADFHLNFFIGTFSFYLLLLLFVFYSFLFYSIIIIQRYALFVMCVCLCLSVCLCASAYAEVKRGCWILRVGVTGSLGATEHGY